MNKVDGHVTSSFLVSGEKKDYTKNVEDSRLFTSFFSHCQFSIIITDIDECSRPDTNQCDSNALCNNTEGSYVCSCLNGYQGDGRNCTGKYLLIVKLGS